MFGIFQVSAPSAAWCILQGASPCRVRSNQPSVSSVAPVADPQGEQNRAEFGLKMLALLIMTKPC